MALISDKDIQRIPIPHEPDQWVELKPITVRDLAAMQRDTEGQTPTEATVRVLLNCLKGWSYDTPITAETLDSLDFDTYTWLSSQMMLTGRRSEEEKKESEPPSSLTTELAEASFR